MKKATSKSQQSFNNQFQATKSHFRYPIPLPEVSNIDVLATMPDDDLNSLARRLNDDRDEIIEASSKLDTRPWDEELSYVKREQQIRKIRHDAHEKWLRELDAEQARQEINLPSADLDNSAFVAASSLRERFS